MRDGPGATVPAKRAGALDSLGRKEESTSSCLCPALQSPRAEKVKRTRHFRGPRGSWHRGTAALSEQGQPGNAVTAPQALAEGWSGRLRVAEPRALVAPSSPHVAEPKKMYCRQA